MAGSILSSVKYTLTPEEEREVEAVLARLPAPPPNMTHVEAAFRFEFPTEESWVEWEKSKPSWYHTDDVVVQYGKLKRMSKHQAS